MRGEGVDKPVKKDSSTDSRNNPTQYPPNYPNPPAGQPQANKSLFSQPGPVNLESSKRGILTLGNIGGDTKNLPPVSSEPVKPALPVYSSTPLSMPSSPSIPPPPSMAPTHSMPSQSSMSSSVTFPSPTPRAEITAPVAANVPHSRWTPRIDRSAYIDPRAIVIGNVTIESEVYVAPGAIIRCENDEPILIKSGSYIQEGVVICDLPSHMSGELDKKRVVEIGRESYSVYIGIECVISAQSQIHGPVRLDDGVYVGMQCLVFWASVGEGSVIEPGCLFMNASIPAGIFIPAGLKISNQKSVKDLPSITTQYRFYGIGKQMAQAGQEIISRNRG
jgi:carbonic anhydrase